MVAATLASDGGADVLVVEKDAVVGGTTGVSGGVMWVPRNARHGRRRDRRHARRRDRVHRPARRRSRAGSCAHRGLRRHRARDARVPQRQDTAANSDRQRDARLLLRAPGRHPGQARSRSIRRTAAVRGAHRGGRVGRPGRRPFHADVTRVADHPGRGSLGRAPERRRAGAARTRRPAREGRGLHRLAVEGSARPRCRDHGGDAGARAGRRRRRSVGRAVRARGCTAHCSGRDRAWCSRAAGSSGTRRWCGRSSATT